MITSISVEISSVSCSACNKRMSFRAFEASGGVCACRGAIFNTSVRVRTTFTYTRDVGEAMTLAVTGALKGGVRGADMMLNANSAEGSEDRSYELCNLPGAIVFDVARFPPESALEFISDLRREAAKANLQADQGICKECGEVFNVGTGGFTAEGFCSKLCKRRYEIRNPPMEPAPAAVPSSDNVLNCPQCSKPTKVKAGKKARCIWCGTSLHT